MSLIYHDNLKLLVIGRGILGAGFTTSSSISVYSGEQPPAADILANWANYKSTNSNLLIHYTGVTWSHPISGEVPFCSIYTFPAATLPKNAGKGTWAILWPSAVTDVNMAAATIPNVNFLVVSVDIFGSESCLTFYENTDFVMGVTKSIADGLIEASLIQGP